MIDLALARHFVIRDINPRAYSPLPFACSMGTRVVNWPFGEFTALLGATQRSSPPTLLPRLLVNSGTAHHYSVQPVLVRHRDKRPLGPRRHPQPLEFSLGHRPLELIFPCHSLPCIYRKIHLCSWFMFQTLYFIHGIDYACEVNNTCLDHCPQSREREGKS